MHEDLTVTGCAWVHQKETRSTWEEWHTYLNIRGGEHRLSVMRMYRDTRWPPTHCPREDIQEGYEVDLDYQRLELLPLSTTLEEALSMAIVIARMR
jgi:hypothetical protein